MQNLLQNSNIAIVGAGKIGEVFLKLLFGPDLRHLNINVLAVADINKTSAGMVYAQNKGVFTTSDFKDLFQLEDLDTIIELTGNDSVIKAIYSARPENVRLIDYYNAILLFDLITSISSLVTLEG